MREKKFPVPFYLFISFIEGGAVMGIELPGGKMLSSFYGTSFYVWISVLGITLCGLALGYFLGGYLANKYSLQRLLVIVLLAGSLLLIIMPFSSLIIMRSTMGMGVRIASVVSCLVFMMPPLVCMGMFSPVLIQILSSVLEKTGRVSGMVYSVSTFGGIFATFFLGFLIIPLYGIKIPVLYISMLLLIFPVVYFLRTRRFIPLTAVLLSFGLILIFSFYSYSKKRLQGEEALVNIIYSSDGLLGKIVVLQVFSQPDPNIPPHELRLLTINWIPQSFYDRSADISQWEYVHHLSTLASIKPRGGRALLLGLGGGTVANELIRLGFQTDAVELDPRIAKTARDYFNLYKECNVIVDDARHYIKTASRKYDVVIFDIYTGESPPNHVLTKEGLNDLKRILNDEGLVLVNHVGFLHGKEARSWRSIFYTFKYSGFHTKVFFTDPKRISGEILLVASLGNLNYDNPDSYRLNVCCRFKNISFPPLFFPAADYVSFSEDMLLTDEKPILSVLNAHSNEKWRKQLFLDNLLKELDRENIPIF